MKAVILDYDSLAVDDLDLQALWQQPFEWQCYGLSTPEDLQQRLSEAEVVLTNKVVINRAHLQANKQLKLIVIMATGTNNVDLQAARECGVLVCNVVNYSTPAVVQHTFALMLALATRLLDYTQDVAAGDWHKSPFFGLLTHQIQELSGKTLGIIGYGAIGRGVADIARSFGMQVLVAQSFRDRQNELSEQRLPLSRLLPQLDVLSIHCPLTDLTRGLIAEKELLQLKPGAWLINVSRGAIVDEEALFKVLKNGHLSGAGVDVLVTEPPDNTSPLLRENLPNLIVTPHSAWASQQARQRLVDQLAKVLQCYLAGDPLNVVN